MCFGYDGLWRIDYGDTGPLDQRETPFNPMSLSYNVTIIQIIVVTRPSNVEFTAIIDTGSSFTYLTDPIYSLITKKMDVAMKLDRIMFDSGCPFEYCYQLPFKTIFSAPSLNFTMKGGYNFGAITTYVSIPTDDMGGYAVCLAIFKSTSINIIGQNVLTGYRIVFNREKMALGWKEVNCNDSYDTDTPSGNSPPANNSPPPVTLLRQHLPQEKATVRSHGRVIPHN
ncbi:unnamed protein product [Citrullus colocynthis]|uniref:Peptidase A1 domain-containing protein n=1 Tax=Citrullus colocynthis TaxID=252529 RepID=A0ABP0YK69_9ROSI